MSDFVFSAVTGNNSDLLPSIFKIYVKPGNVIADVTYGKGIMWQQIDETPYKVLKSDILTGVDFRSLPYEDRSIDCLILDPPYMNGGHTVKDSINKFYKNKIVGHEAVVRLYTAGILEASRVIKKNGYIIVKAQDESNNRQNFTHIELITILEILGWRAVDLFIMVQTGFPPMRHNYQKTARKNHSYAIVARFRR